MCHGAVARPVASRTEGPTRARRTLCFRRDAAPRTPTRVQRHGESTSCVSATVKGCGSTPSFDAQAFERRVERVEARPLGAEAAVLVAGAVALLHAREVEERRGQVVGGALAAVDLLPRLDVVWDVVAEADFVRADRVEHPAGAAVDPCPGSPQSALRT